jgi:hypothetical protein
VLEDIGYAIRLGLHEFADDHGLSHSIDVRHYHHVENVPGSVGPLDYLIVLKDTLDEPGALGYHYTNPDGTPAALIGVGLILGSPGGTWKTGVDSVAAVIDHEAKETELDRSAARYVFDWHGRAHAEEACDAVQSNVLEGARGVSLSNYVLPNYFIDGAPGPYDKLGVLTAPFSIARGGYEIVADYSNERNSFGRAAGGYNIAPDPRGHGVIVVNGDLPVWAHAQKAQAASRTMRRLVRQQQAG